MTRSLDTGPPLTSLSRLGPSINFLQAYALDNEPFSHAFGGQERISRQSTSWAGEPIYGMGERIGLFVVERNGTCPCLSE
jgi:hypothetical protein